MSSSATGLEELGRNTFLARWTAAMRELDDELGIEQPDPTRAPEEHLNLLFLSFLRCTSRFGFFSFGPVTIHLAPVETAVLESLDQRKTYNDFSAYHDLMRLVMEEQRRSGRRTVDELHVLLGFMRTDAGVPSRVFAELGVSPEAVRAYAASPHEPESESGLETLYSPEEAAAYLKVHVQTVREWIRSGRLPAYRLAGQKSFRVRARDIKSVLLPYSQERQSSGGE